jgi:uncharacterized membrane protein YqaE (UPF0057 family)
MITKLLDPIFAPIISPIKMIVDTLMLIIELIVLLLTKVPEILMMALQILNPINIVNDSITGTIMAVKVVIIGIIDMFKSSGKPSGYSKCRDTGSGLFGYRREKNDDGKIVKNSCGDDKVCKRNILIKYIIAVICPPLALAMHLGLKGWFHIIIASVLTVYTYYFPGLLYTLLHIMNAKNIV